MARRAQLKDVKPIVEHERKPVMNGLEHTPIERATIAGYLAPFIKIDVIAGRVDSEFSLATWARVAGCSRKTVKSVLAGIERDTRVTSRAAQAGLLLCALKFSDMGISDWRIKKPVAVSTLEDLVEQLANAGQMEIKFESSGPVAQIQREMGADHDEVGEGAYLFCRAISVDDVMALPSAWRQFVDSLSVERIQRLLQKIGPGDVVRFREEGTPLPFLIQPSFSPASLVWPAILSKASTPARAAADVMLQLKATDPIDLLRFSYAPEGGRGLVRRGNECIEGYAVRSGGAWGISLDSSDGPLGFIFDLMDGGQWRGFR